MLLVVGILIGLAAGAAGAYVVARLVLGNRLQAATEERERVLADAERDAEAIRREAQVESRELAVRLRGEVDQEVKDKQAEIIRVEARVLEKEEEIDRKLGGLEQREQELGEREGGLARLQVELEQAKDVHTRELERISGMTTGEARAELLGAARSSCVTRWREWCARSRRRRRRTRSNGRARWSQTLSNGWPRVTRPRRPSRSSSCRPTT